MSQHCSRCDELEREIVEEWIPRVEHAESLVQVLVYASKPKPVYTTNAAVEQYLLHGDNAKCVEGCGEQCWCDPGVPQWMEELCNG